MQPKKFLLATGEKFAVGFKTGENFMGEAWQLTKSQVENLTIHQIATSNYLKDSIADGEKNNITHMSSQQVPIFLLESNNALSELQADKFNEYLKDYGLDDILDQRTKSNKLSSPGRNTIQCSRNLCFRLPTRRMILTKRLLDFRQKLSLENPYH